MQYQPGDRVTHIADNHPMKIGTVLETSRAVDGLHPTIRSDFHSTPDSPLTPTEGLVPVHWNAYGGYEWWEDPDNLQPALEEDRAHGGELSAEAAGPTP